MYHHRSHDPAHWNPVTTPSPSALIGFTATVVLLPVVATVLVGNPQFAAGLVVGLGAIALIARLVAGEPARHRQSSDRHATGVPVWFAGLERPTGTDLRTDTR